MPGSSYQVTSHLSTHWHHSMPETKSFDDARAQHIQSGSSQGNSHTGTTHALLGSVGIQAVSRQHKSDHTGMAVCGHAPADGQPTTADALRSLYYVMQSAEASHTLLLLRHLVRVSFPVSSKARSQLLLNTEHKSQVVCALPLFSKAHS